MNLKLFSLLFIAVQALAQNTLSLLFTGDIMGHESQLLSAKKSRNSYDYKPCFKYIKPLIAEVDLAVGNLEVTLPGRKPYTGFMPLPIFRSPDAYAVALKDAGFDVLMNANNHANDGLRRGIRHTIDQLNDLEIHHAGTYKNQTERDKTYPLLVEKNGFRLVFLNYSLIGTNGIPTLKPSIVNKLDTLQIKKDIAKAKELKPDFILAVLHWGVEHSLEVSDLQRAQTKLLTDNGVDMIVGMHPHVVQPLEVVSGRYLVAYSLGNFISNHTMVNADGGILLKVLLEKNAQGQTHVSKSGYVPIWRYIEKQGKKKSYFVLPISDYEQNQAHLPKLNGKDKTAMNAYLNGLRSRIVFPEWK